MFQLENMFKLAAKLDYATNHTSGPEMWGEATAPHPPPPRLRGPWNTVLNFVL